VLKYLRYRFVERQRFGVKERTRERRKERKAPSRFSDAWPEATALRSVGFGRSAPKNGWCIRAHPLQSFRTNDKRETATAILSFVIFGLLTAVERLNSRRRRARRRINANLLDIYAPPRRCGRGNIFPLFYYALSILNRTQRAMGYRIFALACTARLKTRATDRLFDD